MPRGSKVFMLEFIEWHYNEMNHIVNTNIEKIRFADPEIPLDKYQIFMGYLIKTERKTSKVTYMYLFNLFVRNN